MWSTQLNQYMSARMVTKGKFGFTYGRVEVRAKVALTRGSWSAIWTLPDEWTKGSGQWPEVGEIDIMEHVGFRLTPATCTGPCTRPRTTT